jgi:aminotransferase
MRGSKSRRNYVAPYVRDTPRSGIREFFEIVSTRKDIISLSIGEPDFVTPWHIREAAIYALDNGATSYTANLGILALRQAISDYIRKSFGVSYSPETEILVTVGVSEAFDLAMRALVEPGDEVVYHEPCYVSYPSVIKFAHGKPVSVVTRGEDDFRLTRKMLEGKLSKKTKVLILNFPTNPTGATLPLEDLKGIAKLAVERDLVVISDEIYAELTYDEKRGSIASLPGMKERTVLLNGFSKSWAMTGFRVGFACAPPELTEAMVKIHQYTMLCAPILSQKAAVEAIRNGMSDIKEMRSEYRERRNFIHTSLNEIGMPCHLPRGAFYAFPYIGDYGLTSKEFSLKLLNEEKVACVPGSAFGPSGEGYLRCSYATDIDDLKEAMRRMGSFLKRLKDEPGKIRTASTREAMRPNRKACK